MRPVAIKLRCDSVVVRTDSERTGLEALSPVLRDAFARLAERLQAMPEARWHDPEHWALDRLEIEMVSTDELLGPRGAERLADPLCRALV